ncbi:hypothetical protein [Planctomyces sp. SH-PL62]|uniref:hypothetical protein n=1 Tax=Planctomyces sp. SH-PL62 TaxID=1636152 RepID=UPI00078E51C3|nr:hypothetical protein [Planctomyces sp. SH-PL62]AMV35900.1 hypothetical protein VT85_00550 [Planctomyces sp. SH-PL62]
MMKRMLSVAAFTLLSAALAQPASAQFGGGAGDLADQIQKDAKSQLSQQRRYTARSSRNAHMSGPQSRPNYGGADGTGRFDMSGRSVSGYFSVRDRSTSFSGRYSSSRRRSPRPAAPAAAPLRRP